MRSILIIIGCFPGFFASVYAQTRIYGTVLNEKSKQPIPYAHIYSEKLQIGTVSNSKGYFSLALPASPINIQIIFSSIGYETSTQELKDLITDEPTIIYLKESLFELSEIIVSPNSATEIVKNAYQAISDNYIISEHFLSGYYKELEQSSNKVHYIAEALLNAKIPAKNSKDKIQIFYGKTRKTTRSNLDSIGITFTAGGAYDMVEHPVLTGISPMVPEKFGKYKYKIEDYRKAGEKNLVVISFIKKKDKTFSGRFFIDLDSYAFARIEYSQDIKGGWIFNDWRWTRTSWVNEYKENPDKKWFLSFSRYSGDWIKKKTKERFNYFAFYATTKLIEGDLKLDGLQFNKKEGFYTEVPSIADDSFWENFNYVPLLEREKKASPQ